MRIELAARPLAMILLGLALAAACGAACGDGGAGPGTGGGGGAGGAGGGLPCPTDVAPLFTLRVHAPRAALPPDLELLVSWSAGDEPPVRVDQPATFGTSTSNVICALVAPVPDDEGDPPGQGEDHRDGAGDDLLCELWTSGPTRVRLAAHGFVAVDETLAPATTDGCERPIPSEVTLDLAAVETEE